MTYYPDIQEWSLDKLFETASSLFEAGMEMEQESPPRSEWTEKQLEVIRDKHRECAQESHRRMRI